MRWITLRENPYKELLFSAHLCSLNINEEQFYFYSGVVNLKGRTFLMYCKQKNFKISFRTSWKLSIFFQHQPDLLFFLLKKLLFREMIHFFLFFSHLYGLHFQDYDSSQLLLLGLTEASDFVHALQMVSNEFWWLQRRVGKSRSVEKIQEKRDERAK